MDRSDYYIVPLKMDGVAAPLYIYPDDVKEGAKQSKAFYSAYHALIPEQTHSLNVGVVKNRWDYFTDTDALITFQEELPIGVVTADCVPILLHAPDVKGVAAVHAGWKGTLGGIVDKTIDELVKHGANVENIFASFGPSISQEYYEVDSGLAAQFIEAGFEECVSYPNGEESKPHIDLQVVNKIRMLRKGIKDENIFTSKMCTYSAKDQSGKNRYPSFRRDGEASARILSAIMLINEENYNAYINLRKR